MKLIKQKSNWDCGIAAIAMFTNKSYDEVLKALRKLYPDHGNNEISNVQEEKILRHFRVRPIVLPFEFINLKIRSMILIQSLNDEFSWHSIFFDGKNIYDPNNGKIKNGKPLKFYSSLNEIKRKDVVEIVVSLHDIKKLKLVKE